MRPTPLARPWLVYAGGFLLFTGLLVPGLYALALRLGGPLKNLSEIGRFSRPLLPLGLAAWVAFTISFAFAKLSYVLPVLSDPFGIGWNLFGSAHLVIAPDVSFISPLLQSAVLVGGLLWSGSIARQDAGTPRRALALQCYSLLITLGLLVLLVG